MKKIVVPVAHMPVRGTPITKVEFDRDRYLKTRQVCDRYGVTTMTLWRWEQDCDLKFPQAVVIRRRRHWLESALIEWEREQAAQRTRKKGKRAA